MTWRTLRERSRNIVAYAKDNNRVAEFYRQTLALEIVEAEPSNGITSYGARHPHGDIYNTKGGGGSSKATLRWNQPTLRRNRPHCPVRARGGPSSTSVRQPRWVMCRTNVTNHHPTAKRQPKDEEIVAVVQQHAVDDEMHRLTHQARDGGAHGGRIVGRRRDPVVADQAAARPGDNAPRMAVRPYHCSMGGPLWATCQCIPLARYATKRQTQWVGSKIHLTETYGDDQPNLIINGETTNAAVSDDAVTETIHAALAEKQLLPEKHVADTGYVNFVLFVSSKTTHTIALIGPTRGENHWQAKDGAGFAARDVTIDWEQQHAICPMGKHSNSWTSAVDKCKNDIIKITFAMTDCHVCPAVEQCTKATPARSPYARKRKHEALLAGRQREQTEEYKTAYAKRASVEGTIAQSVRTTEVRRSRYVGQAKTHVAHLMAAAVINIVRLLRWLAGEPKAQTQLSPFARLYEGAT